ncbi:hypothetical protein Lal_00042272 [Lupinus albus]|nr:hypothetical protein Lal_00042272 [Lupinus albus]
MGGAEAQERVWLFKHPKELAVPEVLVPDLDGTGSEEGLITFNPKENNYLFSWPGAGCKVKHNSQKVQLPLGGMNLFTWLANWRQLLIKQAD